MMLRVVMLGDIVGSPGRMAVAQQIPVIRERYQPQLVLANAENVVNGSGIKPETYRKLLDAGLDGMTLGDHAFRRKEIFPTLNTEPNIIRPANLPVSAHGRGAMAFDITLDGAVRRVHVITVLGRIFMQNPPADDPFACVDAFLRQLNDEKAIVIVEAHTEATSEKRALGWHLLGRVSAVLGTHTHVPTADAGILRRGGRTGTAYITDLGMCGPYESILGRDPDRVLQFMTKAQPAPFDVAEGDVRISGVVVDIDSATGAATAIERIELPADLNKPPFTAH